MSGVMPMPPPLNPRSGRPRQKLVDEHRAECQAVLAPCWLCGNPIDYLILDRHRHPLRFSTDEVIPVSVDPRSALNKAGFRPSHACCNSSRGDRPVTPEVRRKAAACYRKHATKPRRTLSAAW